MRHTPHRSRGDLSPITLRIADACRITGIGRSKFYELIKAGEIEVIKVGAITLVPMTSIQTLLDRYRPSASEGAFGMRLNAVMHPRLAISILTAGVANLSEDARRDLSSPIPNLRAKAEDAVAKTLAAILFETHNCEHSVRDVRTR